MSRDREIKDIISFLSIAENLKNVTRHSWTSKNRHESVAEHSWRLSLMIMVVAKYFPELNLERALQMSLVHDLGEVYDGDIPAFEDQPEDKYAKEEQDIRKLVSSLDGKNQQKIIDLYLEYNACETLEAKLVRALDKIEAVLQHLEADVSTWAEGEGDYNYVHGQDYMKFDDFITDFRKEIDRMNDEKMKEIKK